MASMPLALSVHSLVSSVGADAGFAAVIGLAILTLLYFAHARETAGLREEAAMLAQRLEEAEARLQAARRAQSAAQPAPAPATVARPNAVRSIPFAPAGLAAPALAAATRFVPVVTQPAPPAIPAAASIKVSRGVGPLPSPSPAQSAPSQPVAPPPVDSDPPAAPPRAEPPAPPVPAPAAPSPAAPPAPVATPAPVPAAVTAFRTSPATVAGAASPRTLPEATNGAPAPPPVAGVEARGPEPRPRGPRSGARGPERHMFVSSRSRQTSARVGRRFAVLVGLIIMVGAVVAVILATSGTGTQNPSKPSGASSPPPVKPAFDPAAVTVAVLNGTNTNQLAHHVADHLAAVGFKEGLIATASNQTLASTTVGYLPGSANRTDALHVASTLHLPASSVAPIDQAAQAVACPPPGSCTADVVVTVGANLATVY